MAKTYGKKLLTFTRLLTGFGKSIGISPLFKLLIASCTLTSPDAQAVSITIAGPLKLKIYEILKGKKKKLSI